MIPEEASRFTTGSEGLGLVSYFNREADNLMTAHCSSVVCSSATISTLDRLGVISYETRAVHCSNVFCIPYFQRR